MLVTGCSRPPNRYDSRRPNPVPGLRLADRVTSELSNAQPMPRYKHRKDRINPTPAKQLALSTRQPQMAPLRWVRSLSTTCSPFPWLLRHVHYPQQDNLGIREIVEHNVRKSFHRPVAKFVIDGSSTFGICEQIGSGLTDARHESGRPGPARQSAVREAGADLHPPLRYNTAKSG